MDTYVSGKEGSLDDPRVSPLKAVATGLLPPCFIIGAGEDTWCLADSLTLAESLSAAASPYELHVMEGLPHGFMQMSALDGRRAAMRLMMVPGPQCLSSAAAAADRTEIALQRDDFLRIAIPLHVFVCA